MEPAAKRRKRLCEAEGCDTQPTFALQGEKARRCAAHREPRMMNVTHKTCEVAGCDTRPNFALPSQQACRCAEHREPGMVDVNNKTCEVAGCDKHPVFALPGERARRCAEHREPRMVDVTHKTCEADGCVKIPSFALLGERARRCADHREPGMVGVVNKTCEVAGCDTRPNFALPGHRASACAQHKTEGMIVHPTKRCVISGCKELALFGTKTIQLHCECHAVEGEINLVERSCVKCGFLNVVNPANGQCGDCDKFFNQSKPVKKKELTIKGFLVHHGIVFTHDRVLEDSCGNKERPDFLIDQGTFYIIIEVDESQHSSYMCARTCECPDEWHRHCKCQQARMIELTQLAQRPCVWLRYNPDKYNGPKVAPAKRQEDLLRHIKYYQAKETLDKEMEVVYLFYDN